MPKMTYDAFIEDKARQLIKSHEGVRMTPYIDTVGKCTIGVGRNLTDRGLTVEEVELLFETDFKLAKHILNIWLSEWQNYPASVQMALLSMAFNLGGPRLAGFVKMRTALVDHDYDEAARQALDSRWAKQVGRRAEEIAKLLADGTS